MQVKYIGYIFSAILIIIFFSFIYFGIFNKIPVSFDYNVPIAKTIISGEFIHLQSDDIYIYFPGSSHSILSIFLLLGFPNLFGLLGFIFLFTACKKLGETFGLNKYIAFIFAASICTTTTVIRTISDQSIDKWLCSWFILSIILLENPSKSWKFSTYLGLSLGMLIGTKYSGPLFFLALLPIYWKTLFQYLNPLRFLITSIIASILGLFWYVRNFVLLGNPYYPANLLFFKGYPGFTQQDWMLWKIPIQYPDGIIPLLNSFISEYMVWSLAIPIIIWFVIYSYRNKQKLDHKIKRLLILSTTTGIACLFLPITPAYKIELFHILSDMRYVMIFMVIAILIIFLISKKYSKEQQLAFVSVVNAIPIFSFIPFQPKIFILSLVIFVLIHKKSFFKFS